MNSSARVVLPDPGSPMMTLIEFSGIPPWRMSSSSRLPVERRLKEGSAAPPDWLVSSLMLHAPCSCSSRFEQSPHRVDERMLSEGFQQEGIRPRFFGSAGRRQDAEDQH